MTGEQADIVDFLRGKYADGLRRAHDLGRALTMSDGEVFGLPAEAATAEARSSVHAAETRTRFFEETVVAYLGTAGPTGRIADQQLRLLAWEHRYRAGYKEAWRP